MTVQIQKKLSAFKSINAKNKTQKTGAFNLQLAFEHSEACLGILGASGCGKSMTLKCIAGIETPDSGHISLDGHVLFDSKAKINLRPQERKIAYLFQSYALFPKMTVYENITVALKKPSLFPGKNKADEKTIAEKAALWIERLGLKGLEKRYPKEISGGEQQRTALARILILEPGVILLDEPFSALDTGLREQMQLLLQTVLKESNTLALMVTHSRDEAYKLCKQLAIMEKGSIAAYGNTLALFENPGNITAAKLTGCKNISPARRTGIDTFYAIDWEIELHITAAADFDLDTVKYIGIRAHDITAVYGGNETGQNEINFNIVLESYDLFENTVIFTSKSVKDTCEKNQIWWKYSKHLVKTPPERLFFPPQSILLLS
ncbi:MAG: ATP-binding cassette domain-containing protein [Spirochaetaceae bacterium]|nr:ATP-binding cassette domain-containing protein [Spirochaetaceae bacterium]